MTSAHRNSKFNYQFSDWHILDMLILSYLWQAIIGQPRYRTQTKWLTLFLIRVIWVLCNELSVAGCLMIFPGHEDDAIFT